MRRARPPQSRPTWPFMINRSSPQARGLVAWYPIAQVDALTANPTARLFDFARNAQASTVGSFANYRVVTSTPGWVVSSTSAVTDMNSIAPLNESVLYGLPTTYNFAIFARAAAPAFGLARALIAFGGTDDLIVYPYDTNAGNGPRVFWRDLGGTIIDLNGGIPAADNKYHDFCFVSYASNDHRLFVDGMPVATSAATGSAGPFNSLRFMGWADGAQTYLGNAYDFRVYDVAPSPALIAAMSDPRTKWDLYQVPQRRVRAFGAVGGFLEDLTLGVERSFAINFNPALGGRGFN